MEPSIPSIRAYITTSMDLAAYCMAQGFFVEVIHSGGKYADFTMEDSPELRATKALNVPRADAY